MSMKAPFGKAICNTAVKPHFCLFDRILRRKTETNPLFQVAHVSRVGILKKTILLQTGKKSSPEDSINKQQTKRKVSA